MIVRTHGTGVLGRPFNGIDQPHFGVAAEFSNLPNELIERRRTYIEAPSGNPPFRLKPILRSYA